MRWVAIRKNLLSSTSKIVSVWSPSSQFSDSRASLGASKVGWGYKRWLRGYERTLTRQQQSKRVEAHPRRRLRPEVSLTALLPPHSGCPHRCLQLHSSGMTVRRRVVKHQGLFGRRRQGDSKGRS